MNCCPSNLLTFRPFQVWIRILYTTVYTYTLYKGGGGIGFWASRQINTCRKDLLQAIFFRWRHFAWPSMSLIFLRAALSGKCLSWVPFLYLGWNQDLLNLDEMPLSPSSHCTDFSCSIWEVFVKRLRRCLFSLIRLICIVAKNGYVIIAHF